METVFRLLICVVVMSAAALPAHAVPKPPMTPDAALAAKCKAASFARWPAGQMATTMRELQIQRCIKNKGFLG